jgi:hypothetical protein
MRHLVLTLSKVCHLSALCEQEQGVKSFEENGGRLMNGALWIVRIVSPGPPRRTYQNSLATINQFPQEPDDIVR